VATACARLMFIIATGTDIHPEQTEGLLKRLRI
jgi:hypothetical protein